MIERWPSLWNNGRPGAWYEILIILSKAREVMLLAKHIQWEFFMDAVVEEGR